VRKLWVPTLAANAYPWETTEQQDSSPRQRSTFDRYNSTADCSETSLWNAKAMAIADVHFLGREEA
jgi:hypothetical protein